MEDLPQWVERYLPSAAVLNEPISLLPVTGDAGFRQYFRVNAEPSLIAVWAPPEHEDNNAFVSKALMFKEHGIRVPDVYSVDYQQGFMLLSDFGDKLLLPRLNHSSADHLYDRAEDTLLNIQKMPVDDRVVDCFPGYSAQLLQREMDLFPEWFLEKLLGLELNEADRLQLRLVFDTLLASAAEQPQVVVHRDYHSRNLMLLPDDDLGVLDFQDAVIGPLTYDLVSLLRDCYICWPQEYIAARVEGYARRLEDEGLLTGDAGEKFQRWFDLMGLQRHIKVLGIFARLWLRDGKSGYLGNLPLVIRYTLEQLNTYPELAEFAGWFEQRVLPELPKQTWYCDWEKAGE